MKLEIHPSAIEDFAAATGDFDFDALKAELVRLVKQSTTIDETTLGVGPYRFTVLEGVVCRVLSRKPAFFVRLGEHRYHARLLYRNGNRFAAKLVCGVWISGAFVGSYDVLAHVRRTSKPPEWLRSRAGKRGVPRAHRPRSTGRKGNGEKDTSDNESASQ